MAIGFGAGSDMHKTVNKQRSSRKTSKRSLKDSSDQTAGSTGTALKFANEATPEMLEEIRQRKQKENRRNLIAVTTAIVVIGIAIIIAVQIL